MSVDPIAIISATTAAIGLFDKIADQIERFITKRPQPDVPAEYRVSISEKDGAIIATERGRETQRITRDDLQKLPSELLDHVRVYEKSMQNYYSLWSRVYPELALLDGLQKARTEQQLADLIRAMKVDLDGILGFLESAGLSLDDHYRHIRQLVNDY
jgi:DNA polymerase I-like protein with 3'-5' exonuclease and polymerase domains